MEKASLLTTTTTTTTAAAAAAAAPIFAGRTVLVVNDKGKVGDVANFRPITCLPLMWKLFARATS